MKTNIVTVLLVLLLGIYAFAFRGKEGVNGLLSFVFAGSLIWMLMNFRINTPKIEGLEKEIAEQKQTAAWSVVILVITTLIVAAYAYYAGQNIFWIILNPTAIGVFIVASLLWLFYKRSAIQ